MGDKTEIAWTNATWNAVRGCSIVSDGCHKCYAMRVAARFSGEGQPYEGLAQFSSKKRVPQWTGKVRVVPEHLADPLRWTKPRRIFVNSMSDLFHENLSNEDIAAMFGVMAAAPRHTFQILTKRAERMRAWFDWIKSSKTWRESACMNVAMATRFYADKLLPAERRVGFGALDAPWPLPNVWLGVSAEDQANWDARTEHLRQTPAAVRFVSVEPQLGRIDCDLAHPDEDGHCTRCGLRFESGDDRHVCPPGFGAPLDWIIVGGESGYDARPFHVEWARTIVKQCADASVACFVKQLGAHVRTDGIQMAGDWWPNQSGMREDGAGLVGDDVAAFRKTLKNKKGSDPAEWPPSLRVRQFPDAPSP